METSPSPSPKKGFGIPLSAWLKKDLRKLCDDLLSASSLSKHSFFNQQYVDRLFLTTGVTVSASDRATLVTGLNNGSETRASVLRKVVDGTLVLSDGSQQFTTSYGQAFYDQEFRSAFVLMEYFGYLRRDPDGPGFNFWLGKLNVANGDYLQAEMVLAFINSPEYRSRFGQP